MDPCFETATRLARAIRNGRLSSVEATEAHLERIARLNGPINALVVVDHERAIKAARAADRARAKKGGKLGPLHGVPITIKEAFDVAGLHTTCQPSAAQGQHRQERRHPGREIARGGCGHPRQDQCARAVRRLSDRQSAVRYDEEPLGCAAVGRRLDRRRRGRRGGTPVAAGAGQRHRRFGAQSRALQRHLLAEAYGMARARPWPCARPAGRHPGGALHGRVRSAGALRRGSRDGVAHHRRPRRQRGGGASRADRADARPQGRGACASRCWRAIRW